jgi:tellurite methyltransferase
MLNSFEEEYKKVKCYWGLKPNRLVVAMLSFKKKGKALDLGVGEGRNAIFLAENGFDVTGVDISRAGIKKFKAVSKKLNLRVRAIIGDIATFKFKNKYDVIVSTVTLHFLKREQIEKVIQNMKKYTKRGGLNVISVFTEGNPQILPYLFKKGELRKFYGDWKIRKYSEYWSAPKTHGPKGKLHRHHLATLIAEKT